MIVTVILRTIIKKHVTDIITGIKNKDSCSFPGMFDFDDLVENVSRSGLKLKGKLFFFVADNIFIGSRVTAAGDGEHGEGEVQNILTFAFETVISCDCLFKSLRKRDVVECG